MTILHTLAMFFGHLAVIVCIALTMVATSFRPAKVKSGVFNFSSLKSTPDADLPPLLRYPARDGEQLAWRFYDSPTDQLLIFIHGSSYHVRSYHALAQAISRSGAAKVILPNLRGHYQSGRHRGDVDYIGQLEDDIADLIDQLRRQNFHGPVVLGGHSSGGGFGIRFAGGRHAHLVSRFLLLSPVIPRSDTIRQRSAGGWAHLHMRRIIGLALLNAFGIRGFNALPVIEFNKPVRFWDGTETLTYSYRLNTSYHPRGRFVADVRKLADSSAIFIGELDEAVDAQCLARMIKRESPATALEVFAGMDHFGVFTGTAVHEMIIEWIAQRASTPLPRNAPIVPGEIGANGGFR